MANKNGIPRLESTGVTVGTANVRFSFRNHPFLSAPGGFRHERDDSRPHDDSGCQRDGLRYNGNGYLPVLLRVWK